MTKSNVFRHGRFCRFDTIRFDTARKRCLNYALGLVDTGVKYDLGWSNAFAKRVLNVLHYLLVQNGINTF